MDIIQNTLYLTTPLSYVAKDHLTLQVEVPTHAETLALNERTRANAESWRKLAIPIHHLEAICVFGAAILSPSALELCLDNGVAVNFHNYFGMLQARLVGVADTSVMLRRAQFRQADSLPACMSIARNMIAGKIQNSRNSLLRAARENTDTAEVVSLDEVIAGLARQLHCLNQQDSLDKIRGVEGIAAQLYFSVFALVLKQQRASFMFQLRSRRPPRDKINCLLSFTYALLRNDCITALAAVGLDPFVGFLHVDRANRPSLALDLMEEFRPWVADRLAVTLVNRQQITDEHFITRDGGAVEFTEVGRKLVIKAYQERKLETLRHPLLEQTLRIGQMPFVQARLLARHLRGDLPDYVPLIPK